MTNKVIQVTVTKKSGNKTVIGETVSLQKHPIYKKYVMPIILSKERSMIHDENNIANVGDVIFITETRPISKKKVWILKSVKGE